MLAPLVFISLAYSDDNNVNNAPHLAPEVNGYFLKSITHYDSNDNIVGPIYAYKLDRSNRTITSLPYGSEYDFDEFGRVTLRRSVSDPNHSITYKRDKQGNIIERIAKFTDGRLSPTYLEYENNRVTQSTAAVSSDEKYQTDYQYDKEGRLSIIKEHFDDERKCLAMHIQLADEKGSKITFECRFFNDSAYAHQVLEKFSYVVDSNGNTTHEYYDSIIEEDRANGETRSRIHRLTAEFQKVDFVVPNLDLFEKMQSPIDW